MAVVYEVAGIPVNSCLMFDDQASAAAFPRRDLALGFCDHCGFLSNVVFDSSVQEYSDRYEDQQSFSPRFRDFQRELVAGLIERYDVRGKDVLEIGCSKGDFLIAMCREGGNRGVGIDPSCIPGRVQEPGAEQVRFIQDFYSESYSDLPCDFVCCRHTLEHIHLTDDFVGMVRRAIGDRRDTLAFFEVPDVVRVLKEQAFWDIYYEHCSYFSLGSLARVFRANRFEVVELARDYDDQYLLIVARPTDEPTTASLPEEDDLDTLRKDVANFQTQMVTRLDGWRGRLKELRGSGRRAAIWGSGSKCVSFLSTLGVGDEVAAIVDINPHRHGRYLAGSGKQVVSPRALRDVRPDVVFVMNPIYCDEIKRDLDAMGVTTELVPV